jgi:hypothetical protein
MNADELQMRLDGVIPSNAEFLDRVISSDWFQGLKKSQRAMYVVCWFNYLALGSNQHKPIKSSKSTRYAAEQAQIAIAGAAA